MDITKTYNKKELTIEVSGRIDTVTTQDFENEINTEIENFDSLIIDFTELEYISSAGLRVLMATQKQLKQKNIPMTVKNVNENIGKILKMSGFDKLLNIEFN